MIDLEKIKKNLLLGKTIEEILKAYDWKDFEKIVAEIFERNNFETKTNFQFKTKRKYEIDIIAIKNNFIFCIDCKSWSSGRYKKSGLKKAVIKQEERTKEFKKFLKKDVIATDFLNVTPSCRIDSLLVTLLEEDFIIEKNTFVVPIWKLNSFLINF